EYPDITLKSAKDELSQASVDFTLDGNPLDTMTTSVKPFLGAEVIGLTAAYYTNFGNVMAPEALSIGTHSLQLAIFFPGDPVESNGITFYIDAPGTGACL